MDEHVEGTILILEDDEGLLDVAGFSFSSVGFKLLTARNMNDALALLKTNTVDAIISDINLEGESGLDFYKKVKSRPGKQPQFIFVTAHPVDWARISGGTAQETPPKFFYKPCSFVRIAEYIKTTLHEVKK